ncbi:MAG: hypothetical protein GOMPHAMPRED_008158 [Gomphillus americanus]|uniref:Uncharacterized protein n=1 Tax=Gomphillus americanus TaxID=1940652 RepID=A0A8H3EXR1_9LECA|nr:MAG: hypothetical protein GOMPHAMPRED_008158 [Gomphillus americanus]
MDNPNVGPLSAGSHGSFPQTGSWGMLDLAKLPVQASIGVLSRYAAGRVNPYTVLVCGALCNSFRLTARGRANIETAVDSLKTVGAVGATLEFGFGIEDLIRSMTKSEHGTVVLALCAALREVYSIDVATEVLLEMARLTEVGEKWMPSSREWKAMLNACNGVLAATPFGLRAEVLMQLGNDGQRLGAVQRLEAPQDLRDCSSPRSIAEALFAMAAVSRKEMEAITLIGGPDTGWLAAVAEWILDLKVSISNSDKEIIYTNIDGPGAAQIQVISRRKAPKSQDVIVQGRTYVLKEISEVLGRETTSSIATTVSGRVEWKTALRSAFLLDFKRMIDSLPSTLGALLGSAARLYKGIAQADKSFSLTYRNACTTYCDSSFGSGFVGNMLSWFPELKTLREHMEKAAAKSLEKAKRDYEASIFQLRQNCSCLACQAPSNGFEPDADVEMTPAPASDDSDQENIAEANEVQESSASDIDDWDPDRYCAVIIAETIIVLARALANVSFADSIILPMRSGFELAYGRQLTMRRSAQSGRSALKELGQFAFCMDFDANFSFGMSDNDYGTGIRLDHVLELFTGEQVHFPSDKGTSAACSRGLCAYFQILEGVSISKSDIASIRVIPGRIQYQQKSYTTLEDRHVVRDEEFETTITDLVHNGAAFPTLELSVKESSTALECLVRLPRLSGPEGTVVAGPANLADFIAARRGLVCCNLKKGSRKLCPKLHGLTAEERKQLNTEGGHIMKDWIKPERGVWFIHIKDPLAARVTLSHCTAQYTYRSRIFLVDGECLDCCLRTAVIMETLGSVYFLYL